MIEYFGKYDVILIDPPWEYDEHERTSFNKAAPEYNLMSISEVSYIPIDRIAKKNALLWIWTTKDFRADTEKLFDNWGFKFATEYVWVKRSYEGKLQVGLGHYNRLCHEYLLLGFRGNSRPLNAKRERSVFFAARTEHSKKPNESYKLIERNCKKNSKKLELFARARRKGWDVWGDEIPQHIPVENIWRTEK